MKKIIFSVFIFSVIIFWVETNKSVSKKSTHTLLKRSEKISFNNSTPVQNLINEVSHISRIAPTVSSQATTEKVINEILKNRKSIFFSSEQLYQKIKNNRILLNELNSYFFDLGQLTLLQKNQEANQVAWVRLILVDLISFQLSSGEIDSDLKNNLRAKVAHFILKPSLQNLDSKTQSILRGDQADLLTSLVSLDVKLGIVLWKKLNRRKSNSHFNQAMVRGLYQNGYSDQQIQIVLAGKV